MCMSCDVIYLASDAISPRVVPTDPFQQDTTLSEGWSGGFHDDVRQLGMTVCKLRAVSREVHGVKLDLDLVKCRKSLLNQIEKGQSHRNVFSLGVQADHEVFTFMIHSLQSLSYSLGIQIRAAEKLIRFTDQPQNVLLDMLQYRIKKDLSTQLLKFVHYYDSEDVPRKRQTNSTDLDQQWCFIDCLLTYPCLGFKSVMFFLYELGVVVRISQISPVQVGRPRRSIPVKHLHTNHQIGISSHTMYKFLAFCLLGI